MLNENRVKLMTRMASYEDNEGKKAIHISSYFRSDYILFNMVKTIVSATVAYIVVIAVYIYYNIDGILQNIYKMDIQTEAKKFLAGYAVVAAAYAIIAYIVYSYRYDRARKSLSSYTSALRRLSGMYKEESQEY